MKLEFKPLTIADRDTLRSYTYVAGQRNCNFSFANLAAWQPTFKTQFATTPDALALRYYFSDEMAYMLVVKSPSEEAIVNAVNLLLADAASLGEPLYILGSEDDVAEVVKRHFGSQVDIQPLRDSYDYIYRREALASLSGRALQAKRNHRNQFLRLYPHYEYRALTKELFPQCLELAELWRNKGYHENPPEYEHDSIAAEKRVMEFTFDHWDELGTLGGALFVEGTMVAFTYGGPITPTTFDVCVEKADTDYEGAFTVINQEFCRHLPTQYIFVNREEDMGLEGLRKAKSSYHPDEMLGYNSMAFKKGAEHYYLVAGNEERDKKETCEWMCRQYGFDWDTTWDWLTNLHINWPLTVKALDQDERTIGLLTMSDYRIEEETPQMAQDKPALLERLNQFSYAAVFSFIVAPDRKGTRLNYDMLQCIMPQLKQYDFIFVPVLHHLKTHEYWKRWGATLFYEDADSKYYLIANNPAVLDALQQDVP